VKPPLLRAVCAAHKTKTIGRVVGSPDGPVWLIWAPLDARTKRGWLEAHDGPVPQHRARQTLLASVEADGGKWDGYLPARCPRCKDVKWVHLSTVKDALAKPSSHRVPAV
jgi:phage FluMu protein Com